MFHWDAAVDTSPDLGGGGGKRFIETFEMAIWHTRKRRKTRTELERVFLSLDLFPFTFKNIFLALLLGAIAPLPMDPPLNAAAGLPQPGCRSISAAAGSVMWRAEIRGSTHTSLNDVETDTRLYIGVGRTDAVPFHKSWSACYRRAVLDRSVDFSPNVVRSHIFHPLSSPTFNSPKSSQGVWGALSLPPLLSVVSK